MTVREREHGKRADAGPGLRIGLMLAGGGGMTVGDMASLAARAEHVGFHGVYVAEAWRSGFAPLAAMAARTKRVALGPYVLNAHVRTPLIAGMSAVDLDEISGGRLVLGVGSGNRVTNESHHGVPVERPLRKMREYMDVLRLVTRARRGERVEYAGEIHRVSGWPCQVDPFRPSVPLLLAATSPRMTRLAAQVADGIALGTLQSAEFVGDIAARCRDIAGRADFRVTMASLVAVDDDPERARDAARAAVVNLYAGKPHPHYDSLLRQQGHEDVADAVDRLVRAGDLEAARRAVTDEVVERLVVAGTPEECLARVRQYAGSVDELLFVGVHGMRYEAGSDTGRARRHLLDSYRPLLALGEHAAVEGARG
ncbi:LLM class flavin-dependent oxidoreductase [Streptomyces sp. NPDC050625]|uniref:LLM class flavin-dependent oxidoreductase n=1 Tax=Streptomyces sp. NPDC050625 TaxID=3154629 RepID=UPI003444C3E0